jgi:hypothetical protein
MVTFRGLGVNTCLVCPWLGEYYLPAAGASQSYLIGPLPWGGGDTIWRVRVVILWFWQGMGRQLRRLRMICTPRPDERDLPKEL